MRRAEVRPANEYYCAELAATMRDADLEELEAASGRNPLDILLDGLRVSAESWAVIYKGQVMAIWGVVPFRDYALTGRIGSVWMLTSDLVDKHPRVFWRACLDELPELLARWSGLFNWIHLRHMKALRWGSRLGFKFEPPAPYGSKGNLFVRFWIDKESLNVRASHHRDGGRDGGRDRDLSVREAPSGQL